MRSLTITRSIAALTVGTVVLLPAAPPSAQNRETGKGAPFWPGTTGRPVVQEWYTDIPWHQKLGTFAGNEIDEALVLPYEALGEQEKTFCTNHKLTPEDCMLELGINNVLGTLRTDSLYNPQEKKITNAQECKDPTLPCIEVKLELSSFWTRSTGSGPPLQERPFGTEPPVAPPIDPPVTKDAVYYGGYAITDGSTYAPQMPWYMAHYCDSFFPPGDLDAQDPVCYGDYFSPFNDGFNILPLTETNQWPNSAPWSVFPSGAPPTPTNHCKPGETKKCTLAMAGFDLREVPTEFNDLQYKKYNEFLLTWFNGALGNFPQDLAKDTRHFPWSGKPISWPDFIYPRAVLNPFLGQFDFKETAPADPPGCDITVDRNTNCKNTEILRASRYLYPRQCKLGDLAGAAAGMKDKVARLRQCGLNYELHHNGYWVQWPQSFWDLLWCGSKGCNIPPPGKPPSGNTVGMIANQYGRTSFLFAGVPGLQLPEIGRASCRERV